MKNITICVQPTSITQTDLAMPKSIYPVVISDGATTSTTLDPLDYLITNIDSIHRFRIYIKNNDGHEKEISLPVHIQKNIIEFIKNHRDSSKWCCQDFTVAAHGLYQRGQQDFHSGQWKLASLSETRLHELKAGDFIGMEGGYADGHAVLYLGEGLYLSKLGYKHGLAICKLEDMKKSYQRLIKFTPAVPIPGISAPQPIISVQNPNMIIAKKINDVAIAIIKGMSDGLTDLLSLVLHPLDNVVYPMADLLYDTLIIAAVHNEVLEPHAVFAMNSPQYLKAATRMAERINGLIEIYNNRGEVFLNAPLEVQVEQLSRLMTNLLLPGKVFQGFQTVYAGAKNFKTLGVFKNPPLFLNTRPEGLSPNLKWSPLTKEQLKSIKDTTECIYVITEDRQLIMAPKLLEKPVLNAEGTRTITEIHHHELSKLCPVIAAGELEVVNGAIRSINNMSGRYLPSGPHLQTIVEKVFNKEGYVIKGKYQESVWVQHYSSEHAIIQQAAPLATTKLNPFVQLARFISATTKDTDLKFSEKRTAYELAKIQREQEIQSQLKLLPTQLTSSSSFTDAIRAIRNLRVKSIFCCKFAFIQPIKLFISLSFC